MAMVGRQWSHNVIAINADFSLRFEPFENFAEVVEEAPHRFHFRHKFDQSKDFRCELHVYDDGNYEWDGLDNETQSDI